MDTSLMINRKESDRSSSKEQKQKLNEFQDWLMSGIIDPQRAKEIIELYYKEMPF
nr:MAG TPA: putative membrane protein [Caudoviricetes sp.]